MGEAKGLLCVNKSWNSGLTQHSKMQLIPSFWTYLTSDYRSGEADDGTFSKWLYICFCHRLPCSADIVMFLFLIVDVYSASVMWPRVLWKALYKFKLLLLLWKKAVIGNLDTVIWLISGLRFYLIINLDHGFSKTKSGLQQIHIYVNVEKRY